MYECARVWVTKHVLAYMHLIRIYYVQNPTDANGQMAAIHCSDYINAILNEYVCVWRYLVS